MEAVIALDKKSSGGELGMKVRLAEVGERTGGGEEVDTTRRGDFKVFHDGKRAR